ncbi:LysR family transcriptional regulator [Lacimicrobium alkaliphilum]|uniref:Transcriptional regulator n=1 Tax=Lacimicrobium alkaliphilum TaxID=1526571 RepID=A0ABQ1R2J5_9ALTE|nr:LysR family transcriptional regulator [Lacimicrobium alkaliphilum]GGD54050.1 transcriptional regulator [Lacimicrobium alkaliphilum]
MPDLTDQTGIVQPGIKSVSYRQLQVFVQLAQSGSFADAADRLHLSQPALSIAIKKFEQLIGGALLSRTTRAVKLTVEGRSFLPVAQRLLRDWDEAFTDLHNLFAMQRGKLTVAAMPSFANSLLPNVLSTFHQHYDSINIAILDVVMERVVEAVRDERAELGIIFEARQMEGLDFLPLFNDSFLVIMSTDHPLADKPGLHWQDLQHLSYVAMNRGSNIRNWCDQTLQAEGIEITLVAEASQLSTVGQLVATGMGVSVVPAICRQEMQGRGLCCVPLNAAQGKRVGVIKRSRGSLSVPAARLLEQLHQMDWQTLLTKSV